MSPLFSGDSQAFYQVTSAGPAPSPPSGPSSRALRPARLAAVRRCPALPGPQPVTPAATLARKLRCERRPDDFWAEQPHPGGPPGKKHVNCGFPSVQSLKGVYYLLVKKSAGDAPVLIALSTMLWCRPRGHVQMQTSFQKSLWNA